MKRRILAFFLVLILCSGLLPSFSEEDLSEAPEAEKRESEPAEESGSPEETGFPESDLISVRDEIPAEEEIRVEEEIPQQDPLAAEGTEQPESAVEETQLPTENTLPFPVPDDPFRITLGEGDSLPVREDDVTEKEIRYLASSDEEILHIEKDGSVTARSVGEAYLKDEEAVYLVTVLPAPGKITISVPRKKLAVGEETDAVWAIPEGTSTTPVFRSSAPSVAAVDAENGHITVKGTGTAVISVRTHNGKTARVTLTCVKAPTKAAFSKAEFELSVGQAVAPKVKTDNGNVGSVVYEINDETVARLNEGMVETVGPGECAVKAILYNGVTASCILKVFPAPLSISLEGNRTLLGKGEKAVLKLTCEPNDALANAKWKSTKPSVVKVSASGQITAKKAGTARVTATAWNGQEAVLDVRVVKAPTGVSVSVPSEKLGLGEQVMASAVLKPASAAGDLSWSSSDESVFTLDDSGTVTAEGKGSAILSCKTFNKKVGKVRLTVFDAPETLTLSAAKTELAVGESITVSPLYPEGQTGGFTLGTEPAGILEAAGDTVTALNEGEANIIGETYNGITSQPVTIRVLPETEHITFSQTDVMIGVGQILQAKPEIDPGTASLIRFSVSDPSIAAVDPESGLYKGKKTGTAVITVETRSGLKADLTVLVVKAPASVRFDPAAAILGVGESCRPQVSIPSGTMAGFTYTSSDPAVAQITEENGILATGEGTATITVKTHNGKKAAMTVTVLSAPTDITVDAPSVLGVCQTSAATAVLSEGSSSRLVWSTSDPDVLTVDSEGLITACAEGTATLRADTYVEGVFDEAKIVVLPAPDRISLPERFTVDLTDGPTPAAAELPEGTCAGITWTGNAPGVFSVDPDGLITPVKKGTGTIRAVTHNGLTAEAKVEITDRYFPESIELGDPGTVYLPEGDTYVPEVKVVPEGAITELKWTSSHPKIASVDPGSGKVKGVSYGTTVISAVSQRNPALSVSYRVTVTTEKRCLVIPKRRTGEGDLNKVLKQISNVKQSALQELVSLQAAGTISAAEAEKRAEIVGRAFDMYSFPWMTPAVQKYWKEANSENKAKYFYPGTVYYGLPYTSMSATRKYNVTKALKESRYLDVGEDWYQLNQNKYVNGSYAGNDCSAFCSMAYWGTGSTYSYYSTRNIATADVYKTVSDWKKLRPGDMINRSSKHVIMFLYWADAEKTQFVLIEQGGNEAAINCCSVNIRDVDYYRDGGYSVRRYKSFK